MSVSIPKYQIAKPPAPGTKKTAVITAIKEMKANEIFGPKARNPEQEFFAIHANVDGREMRVAAILKPESKTISPRHSLAQFKERYGAFPEKGMKVQVETNEDGYWALAL